MRSVRVGVWESGKVEEKAKEWDGEGVGKAISNERARL